MSESRRRRLVRFAFAIAVFVTISVLAPIVPGIAAGGVATSVCHDSTPAKYLPADDGVAQAPESPEAVQAVAQYKAAHDSEQNVREVSDPTPQVAAEKTAAKQALIASGNIKRGSATILSSRAALEQACLRNTGSHQVGLNFDRALSSLVSQALASTSSGPGYAWVDWLNQQGQGTTSQNSTYYCGPASGSEITYTLANSGLGRGAAGQNTMASWMGTTSDGTSVSGFNSGINTATGAGYAFVWLSYSPTADERNTFFNRLNVDVTTGYPVAGDAWEVAGYDHLNNHPINQTIFHWFQIGGYGSYGGSAYYQDSATTVWSGVQPNNWIDMQKMIGILGGRGYEW